MNKKIIKVMLFAPTLALTACGYGLKEIYDGNLYNSPVWENNYYRTWDSGMKEIKGSERYINNDDLPFFSFSDTNFKLEEPDITLADTYSEDSASYSMSNSLSKVDDSFKEGYVSKLFDGKLYCWGRYETVRVQIDESGFGTMFSKEMVKGDYFLIHFKSELDFKSNKEISIPGHQDDITLNIGFYYKSDTGYKMETLKYDFKKINTNYGEAMDYVAFGFSLKNINTERLCGVSVTYKLNKESYNEKEGTDLAHALFIYEIMMPKSTWR